MSPRHRRLTELTAEETRLVCLRSQGLLGAGRQPSVVGGVLERAAAVQLDTIAVLARSHELVAYARLGPVQRGAVEQAYWGKPAQAFEYYAHGNCILPVRSWPYFAFRRRANRARMAGRLSAMPVLKEVRARLRHGPVTVGDLGGVRPAAGWWSWSEAKRAVEMLYLQGEAVCTTRHRWKRVYDLPERALPRSVLGDEPSDEECYAYLVDRAARALGVGTRRDLADYFRLTTKHAGTPPESGRLLDAGVDAGLATGRLLPVTVRGWEDPAFVDPAALEALAGEQHRTTLLSPFDSLVWERPRTERLFGFALSLEAYKRKDQRIHGYFSMPLLAEGQLIGRVDPARDGRTLVARRASLAAPWAVPAMAGALHEAAAWVGSETIKIEQVQPPNLAPSLRRALDQT